MMSNRFLQIKEADNHGNKYYYAERLGVDSIAFILYNRETQRVGLIKEYKPPIGKDLVTAFGGSLDNPELTPFETMKVELKEEAGYQMATTSYCGTVFVSTQMNQFCHLYFCDVTGMPQGKSIEDHTEVVWLRKEEVLRGQCWKAITILTKMGMV